MIPKSSTLSAVISLALAGLSLSVAANAAEYRAVKQHVDGQYIVVLKDTAARMANEPNHFASVHDVAAGMAASYQARLLQSYDHVLRGFAIRASEATMRRLLNDPRVAYIEDDARAHSNTTQNGADWGLDRIDQRDIPAAGFDGKYTYTTTANNVHAYVIDSGVLASHIDFLPGRVGAGYTPLTDGKGTTDCFGHGTHVAGILGGTTYGVAKGVVIHPVRVLDCSGTGATSDILAGINWVAAHHVSPAVANLSLGYPGVVASVDTAVKNLITSGVTTVIAAGNDGVDACNETPARVATAITVGSTRQDDGRSVFTNIGSCLDLFAPGTDIKSDWIGSTNNATNTISGTSMAAPHVAGAAALYLAGNVGATPAQVAAALLATASPRRVILAGTGSPTGLLYTLGGTIAPPPPGLPPTANRGCDGTGGGAGYSCEPASIVSASPYAIYWFDPGFPVVSDNNRGLYFSGMCYIPPPKLSTKWEVDFTIANRDGSYTNNNTFTCLGGLVK